MPRQRDTTLATLAEIYLAQRPRNTAAAYSRALFQFLEFLNLPAARHLSLGPSPTPVGQRSTTDLGPHDMSIIVDFIDWLAAHPPKTGRGDRLASSTIRQRGTAVVNWFVFMDERALLPDDFPVARALSNARRVLARHKTQAERSHKAIEPPAEIQTLIHFFDTYDTPEKATPERLLRLKLEAARNRALLYTLADTGGRISEVIQLRVDQFARAAIPAPNEVIRREVIIKGGGKADLVFTDFSVNALRHYLEQRRHIDTAQIFVSHDPRYPGLPLNRTSVWRIVSRAAETLGLPGVHPHDFRHWRATQMRRQGVPIEVVQDFLNHRSIEVTRRFYAAVSRDEVNNAARNTRPK